MLLRRLVISIVCCIAATLAATSHAATVTTSPTDLAGVIAHDPSALTGASFVERGGGPTASSSSTAIAASYGINIGPVDGSDFGVISNGNALGVTDPGYQPRNIDLQTSARGAHDVTILRVNLTVPAGHNCLAVGESYFSQDWDFADTGQTEPLFLNFVDATLSELDPASAWAISGAGRDATTADFARTPDNKMLDAYIFYPVTNTAPAAGTGFSAATDWWMASTPVTPGAHVVEFSIFDRMDHLYDSAVALDGLRTVRRTSCAAGLVPGYDVTPPELVVNTPSAGATVDPQPVLTGTLNDSEPATVDVDFYAGPTAVGVPMSTVAATVTPGTPATWTATTASALTPGTYTAVARAADSVTNEAVVSRTFTIPAAATPPIATPAALRCIVPKLKGKTVASARKALKKANCKLGKV
ncbi:MAG: hypothetical protein ACRDKE_07170, partial [Solirubrobacterales bacterium]